MKPGLMFFLALALALVLCAACATKPYQLRQFLQLVEKYNLTLEE